MAGGVDDIDEEIVVVNGRVLGEDGDAALALELVAVEGPLDDPFVRPEDPALMQHGVDKRGLAVIHVSNDGDVAAQGVGDERHPSTLSQGRARCVTGFLAQS